MRRAVIAIGCSYLDDARAVLPGVRSCALITHLNETGGRLAGDMSLLDFIVRFDRALVSECAWTARPVSDPDAGEY